MFYKLVIFMMMLLVPHISARQSSFSDELITTTRSLYNSIKKHIDYSIVAQTQDILLLAVNSNDIDTITAINHRYHKGCAGFFYEHDKFDALEYMYSSRLHPKESAFLGEVNADDSQLKKILSRISVDNLKKEIMHLSSYRNRYYRSSYGVASQQDLYHKWSQMFANRSDVEVKLIFHDGFSQPSVHLKLKGHRYHHQHVVIGGHGDSIKSWATNNEMLAPGADDNASGIAVLTETLRLIAQGGLKSARNLHFFSYAAEEVGLRGSSAIAKKFKKDNYQVLGVLQFDMTNYSDNDKKITLISDYTSHEQNTFIHHLINKYLPQVVVFQEKCGYACSDHASWHRQGFLVSFPFETSIKAHNPHIHTVYDTLANMDNSAYNSKKFVTIALAFGFHLALLSQ